MAGLVPAIHVFFVRKEVKTWMPGTRPGMTAADHTCKYFARTVGSAARSADEPVHTTWPFSITT